MPTTKDLTILTLREKNIQDFSASRNRLLKNCQTEWAFFVDQDEEITKELLQEVTSKIKSDKYVAYKLRREDHFLGSVLAHGENGKNRFVRLVKVKEGKWTRPVHEVWLTKGPIGELQNPLIHKLPNLTTFIHKINFYSSLEAQYRYKNNISASLFHIAFFPFGKFFYNYIFRLGILDGIPGLIMAALMAFHSYLTWTKLYLLWHRR